MKKVSNLLLLLILMMGMKTINADQLLPCEYSLDKNDIFNFELKGQRITPTDPPVSPVRAIAEYERSEAVLVAYPLGIPVQLVKKLAEESPVIVIVDSQYYQNQANSDFQSANVDMSKISYIVADHDSYWTRDYTPWWILNGDNQVSVLNFEYNRPRPNDNQFPSAFAQEYDYPYYAMNIEQTGGNYMCDGYGSAVQSHIAYSENGNNETMVNETMLNYMGISQYMVVQDPNNTYIDHVDCWGKFLAPDKIVIRSVAQSHPQYQALEDVAEYFATRNCAWGYPYEVYRTYANNSQPYTNSLILNDRVFVPITGSSDDDDALAVYEQALPGYRVFGITNNTYHEWMGTDALHCRTHEIPDRNMLSIQTYPLYGDVSEETVTIEATIKALSGEEIYADSTYVLYRAEDDSDYQIAQMSNTHDDTWSVDLPSLENGTTYKYYIHSADASNRSENYPLVGAPGAFEFTYVNNSNPDVAPVINFTPIEAYSNEDLPITVTCEVTDENDDVESVILKANVNGVEEDVTFTAGENNNYSLDWSMSYNSEEENVITYKIVATDEAGLTTETEEYTLNLTVVANDSNDVIASMGISNVYPNPFRNNVRVSFSAKNSNRVVKVYNIKGQLVKSINTSSKKNVSSFVTWNGKDNSGERVATGVYYFKIDDGADSYVKKMILMK